MGPSPPQTVLGGVPAAAGGPALALGGFALMSTRPGDFHQVRSISRDLTSLRSDFCVVPCFGVHPWFLHELSSEDWELSPPPSSFPDREQQKPEPKWLIKIEEMILSTPYAVVGEIGLDGFHFRPDTGELASPIDRQVEAFRLQMKLAARLERPVSIHAVKCLGQLMETISKLPGLPPKLYFHAFGGKVGTVEQILALCGREPGKVYFGFAPVVNFRSPKTADVIRKIGLERLVLETDHEDAAKVLGSIESGIEYVAQALEVDRNQVVERTTKNAYDLYGLHPSGAPTQA